MELNELRATYDHPADKSVIELIERLEQAEESARLVDDMLRAVLEAFGSGPETDPIIKARQIVARLEQAEQAVARVRELGDAWKSRGEHSMKYSETLQWPVAEAIHEGGADMVNNANLIYRALDGDTRG